MSQFSDDPQKNSQSTQSVDSDEKANESTFSSEESRSGESKVSGQVDQGGKKDKQGQADQPDQSSQTNKSGQSDFTENVRDEALAAAEKGLEAARAALEAAERKLAEAQRQAAYDRAEKQDTSRAIPVEPVESTSQVKDGVAQAASGAAQQGSGAAWQPQQPTGGASAPQPQQPTSGSTPQPQQPNFGNQQAHADTGANVNSGASHSAGSYSYPNAAGQQQGYQQQSHQAQYAQQAQAHQTQTQQPHSAHQTYQQPPVQPHYAPPVASRDHVAAGLLAIFLGCLGVHKFYLGYNTQGFIMLALGLIGGLLSFGLILGIVWIVAFIEGIIYLVKSQSEFERIYVYGKREWF